METHKGERFCDLRIEQALGVGAEVLATSCPYCITMLEDSRVTMDVAEKIEDLRVPPGNRLEALKGKRQGQWSVRINDQWRICFRFKGGSAVDVEIGDYH
jgi:proteic killer suppression protein